MFFPRKTVSSILLSYFDLGVMVIVRCFICDVRVTMLWKPIGDILFSVKYDLHFQDWSFDVELLFDFKLLVEVKLLFNLKLLVEMELLFDLKLLIEFESLSLSRITISWQNTIRSQITIRYWIISRSRIIIQSQITIRSQYANLISNYY